MEIIYRLLPVVFILAAIIYLAFALYWEHKKLKEMYKRLRELEKDCEKNTTETSKMAKKRALLNLTNHDPQELHPQTNIEPSTEFTWDITCFPPPPPPPPMRNGFGEPHDQPKGRIWLAQNDYDFKRNKKGKK